MCFLAHLSRNVFVYPARMLKMYIQEELADYSQTQYNFEIMLKMCIQEELADYTQTQYNLQLMLKMYIQEESSRTNHKHNMIFN